MAKIQFTREFRHWAKGKCVFCKLALWVYRGGKTYDVPEEVAIKATQEGAGVRLDAPEGDRTP